MQRQPLATALAPILLLHTTRANGAGFLIDGVVGPALDPRMATAAATGDLLAAALAAAALVALHRSPGLGRTLSWVFSLLGMADLAMVAVLVAVTGVDPGDLGAMYLVVVAIVPGLMLTHLLAVHALRTNEEPTT